MVKEKSIMIDPGHGGTDPGASGYGIREKDWTLEISLYQYKRLKELGAKVGITRTDNRTLSSVPRTNLIKGKYDLCISNHWNAFNGSARGIETIHSLYGGKEFATNLANALVKVTGLPLRRVFTRKGKSGDYYFMHRMTGSTTTAIVEYGFIDNQLDHNWYKNNSNFYKAAEAVIEVVCKEIGVKYIAPDGTSTPKPIPPSTSKPKPADHHGSIVDYMNASKMDSSFNNRKRLASTYGIRNYQGTASQNVELLNKLKTGSIAPSEPKPAPAKPIVKKPISTMAYEIDKGLHGNGHVNRRASLGISQAEYDKVRAEVNRRAGVKTAPTQSVSQMASRILTGKGVPNGHDARRKWLGVDNATYQKVRAEVNRRSR